MSLPGPGRPATLAEFMAIPEAERFHEIIDGELVQKATPSPKHSRAQANLVTHINARFGRRGGGPPDRPGGWWFLTEAEILFQGSPSGQTSPAGGASGCPSCPTSLFSR